MDASEGTQPLGAIMFSTIRGVRWDGIARGDQHLSRSVPHARLRTAGGTEKYSKTRFGQPCGGSVAIDLQSGHPQTRNPVSIDRALPSKEFFYGELIPAANFFQTDGATAHCIDHHCFAPGDPALRVW